MKVVVLGIVVEAVVLGARITHQGHAINASKVPSNQLRPCFDGTNFLTTNELVKSVMHLVFMGELTDLNSFVLVK